MNLETIRNEYTDHAARLMVKGGTAPSYKQLRGINHYLTSAADVQALIDQGPIEAEEFVQHEYTPEHLQFAPTKESGDCSTSST